MATQITEVYKWEGKWAINIDFEKEEYRVSWAGSWRDTPDLTTFPDIADTNTATRIHHSAQVHEIWAKSSTVCHGSDSHIRLLDPCVQDDDFPVCKVAVNACQRRSIQDEFVLLQKLVAQKAPVVSVHPDPLVDEDGIFGFRMEQLIKVPVRTLIQQHADEVQTIMQQIHDAGVVHNDFHPGNVMQRPDKTMIIIDFGRAGFVGQDIPTGKELPLWKKPTYAFEADTITFEQFFTERIFTKCLNH
ncbi:hypothetical protein SPBR_08902 [Sporothrix brasiliensis 5110]|uniref:Aminoglycoside phosphotransferase domain-containing protein n=1 Tax=Sporothrix brasiliensis 5110 TaxID=1398154 RepID=A0A0C2F6D0_9PEZI|nr:uncharacterized protein SPBR_08902 [Sporothrix brasiliensis 5110]KIH86558.1 hypothetical protein SPBR_08902 [Sporothrix brasiliensis 5110]